MKSDARLQKHLTAPILRAQVKNGSWNETVLSTANHVETLLELGTPTEAKPLRKAAGWLLSQCEERPAHLAKQMGEYPVGHHMFSSANRGAEFESARAEKPEWIPRAVCYGHLPMIQNGAALRALIRLGFGDDARVRAACDNLVEIHEAYGGWCNSNITHTLLARKREGRI